MDQLKKRIITQGNGQQIPANSTAVVHYRGRLMNGLEFDSSYSRNQPFEFVIGMGQVIQGWDIGVASMTKGETCELSIPAHLAYGNRGIGPIPPNSALIFEVTLLGWK